MIEVIRLVKIVWRIDKLLVFRILKDKILKFITLRRKRKFIKYNETYNFDKIPINNISFSYLKFPDYEIVKKYSDEIQALAEKVIEHKFNIFCSGEIRLEHGVITNGFNGFNYSSELKFISWEDFINNYINNNNKNISLKLSSNISKNYKPIDWQLDIKSGYRWSEKQWYADVKYGNIPAADIKVPWEIGRFQHLIPLALMTFIYKTENKDYSIFKYEFQNQILDFIASNPPEFGCQWKSPMEVGIRAVNWLVTFDLFKSLQVEFDKTFEEIFAKSIYKHAEFIVDNKEWASGLRNNHYFCNMVSLIIICSYLTLNQKVNSWLNFALNEFFREVIVQFNEDGGNFESSLSYHYLTTEMLLWGLMFIESLPDEKLNSINIIQKNRKLIKRLNLKDIFFEIESDAKRNLMKVNKLVLDRLVQIFDFTQIISRKDGTYAQIGDNDSGRFLIFSPYQNKTEANKNLLTIHNLFEIISNKNINNIKTLEYYFANTLKLKNGISSELNKLIHEKSFESITNRIINLPYSGIYLFKNNKYQAEVRCGELGQWGKGGHDHNDHLSITIDLIGNPLVVDPGTYVYTSFKELRNKFRSVSSHNTLFFDGIEQNPFIKDSSSALFWMERNRTKSKVIELKDTLFIAEHIAYEKPHKRIINFNENSIEGTDICEIENEKIINFNLHPEVLIKKFITNGVILECGNKEVVFTFKKSKFHIEDYDYSDAYGCVKSSKRICLKSNDKIIEWEFKFTEK